MATKRPDSIEFTYVKHGTGKDTFIVVSGNRYGMRR
jgi:hypothetical protein